MNESRFSSTTLKIEKCHCWLKNQLWPLWRVEGLDKSTKRPSADLLLHHVTPCWTTYNTPIPKTHNGWLTTASIPGLFAPLWDQHLLQRRHLHGGLHEDLPILDDTSFRLNPSEALNHLLPQRATSLRDVTSKLQGEWKNHEFEHTVVTVATCGDTQWKYDKILTLHRVFSRYFFHIWLNHLVKFIAWWWNDHASLRGRWPSKYDKKSSWASRRAASSSFSTSSGKNSLRWAFVQEPFWGKHAGKITTWTVKPEFPALFVSGAALTSWPSHDLQNQRFQPKIRSQLILSGRLRAGLNKLFGRGALCFQLGLSQQEPFDLRPQGRGRKLVKG